MRLFFAGLNDSFTLLAFRVTHAKTWVTLAGFAFLLFSLGAIALSLLTNSFIRTIMTTALPDSPTAETALEMQQFLSIYLGWYTTGEMDAFIAASVGLLLGSIVFVPFSGYVIHGMVSHSEMIIVKNGDAYKIGDSVLFQIISSFTLIQLVGLTVVAQLLTFDSTHSGYAVVFVWAVWLFMTLLTAAFSWVVEYVARRFGPKMRIMFMGLFVAAIAAFLLLDPKHGTTLFGSSAIIFSFMNELASGNTQLLIASLIIVAGMCVAAIYALSAMAAHTLQIPEPLTISTTGDKQIRGTTTPLSPILMITQLLFRYNTVTKPVMTSLAFSLVIVLLLKGENALSTTLIVLPLAVGVSFGANIFGLISGSVNWLFTINGWQRKMLNSGAIIILTSILGIYAIVYGVGLLFKSISPEQLFDVLPALIAVSFSTTILSVYLSLSRPLPFSGKARENLISSPTALIGYVAALLFVSGTIGNIILLASPEPAWILSGTTVLVSILCYVLLFRTWMRTEKYTKRLLKETINAG